MTRPFLLLMTTEVLEKIDLIFLWLSSERFEKKNERNFNVGFSMMQVELGSVLLYFL